MKRRLFPFLSFPSLPFPCRKLVQFFIFLLACIAQFLYLPLLHAQGQSPQSPETFSLEVFLITINAQGQSFTFRTTAISSAVWDQGGYLTNNSLFINPPNIQINGNQSGCSRGWDSDDTANISNERSVLGRAKYKITVVGRNAQFIIDALGTSFTTDHYIIYDAASDKFLQTFSCSGSNGDEISQVTLYTNSNGLQPTPPLNLTVSDYNNHPRLSWQAPDDPLGREFFYYQVYRKKQTPGSQFVKIAWNLTSTSFVDDEIFLDFPAATYTYYVSAKTTSSPESPPSNEVSVQGSKGRISMNNEEMQALKLVNIPSVISPNPFHKSTKIFIGEQFPSVSIHIYDIRGRQIKSIKATSVNKFEWDGKDMLGNIVPPGIYFVIIKSEKAKNRQIVIRKKVIKLR